MQEGKRIYCDHQNLRELFDVHLLPTVQARCARTSPGRKQHNAEIVGQLELPEAERRALEKWARRYAFWGGLGMYLGGNSVRLGRGVFGWVFRLIDRWMHRGI